MDRRSFLSTSSLALAAPALAGSLVGGVAGSTDDASGLFTRVDFSSDGLALSPREYVTKLGELTQSADFEPDYYTLGGAVTALEQTFAQLLGKQAAIVLPTGTLANHLAVRKLAGDDRRVLVQAESHLFNDSGDCAETLSGLNLIPLAPGSSTMSLAEVESWLQRSAGGRVETSVGVISIENPVRRRGHEMVDPDELKRVCQLARERGIRLHLDGARLFNLPQRSGIAVRDYAALFDTVYVSLWKHFNAASGAVLAGDAEFIEGLYHTRRMFGGSLPFAWPQVAVALHYTERYQQDYANAWKTADDLIGRLQADGRFTVHRSERDTSRFELNITKVTPARFRERLQRHDIHLPGVPDDATGFHLMVNTTLLRRPAATLARHFISALDG